MWKIRDLFLFVLYYILSRLQIMAYNDENTRREEDSRFSQKRISLEDNNPWLQDRSPSDLDRQSTQLADVYVDKNLRGLPDGQTSNMIKRELEAFYRTTDPILVRYTLRKIAAHPNTDSAITDFSKTD